MERQYESDISELIGQRASYHAAPAALRSAIRRDVIKPARQRHRMARWLPSDWVGTDWLRLPAAFAAGLVVALLLPMAWHGGAGNADLTNELVDSHVRSLQLAHLSDVVSTDHHTVKPWFAGKLDYSPPVHDLAQQGFPLAGGRLDVVQGKTIAALVYRRRQHIINVFVVPGALPADSFGRVTRNGFHVAGWSDGSNSYWVVSDLNAEELGEFVTLQQQQRD